MNPSNGTDGTKVQDSLFDEGQLNAVSNTGALQSAGTLEGDQYASMASEEAAMKERFEAAAGVKTRGRVLKFAGLGAALVIGLVLVGVRQLHGSSASNTTATDASVRYHNISLPLADIVADSPALSVEKTQTLSINGQLNVNNSLVLAPASQPATAVAGQLYFDQTSKELSYYNGTTFVPLNQNTPAPLGVSSLGNATGSVALGGGLAVNTGTLSNTGVLTLQGQAGNVTLAAGPGIVVNGTTISNSGLLSLGGQGGDIIVGSGLGISGSTLRNTGIISAVGAGAITVTNDGNGNITIDGPNGTGGSGTVASPGGTIGKIAKFTGVQTIADSLISDNGTVVTVGGDLSVTGNVSFTNALPISSGGTGANSAAGARTNLGAAKSGANSDITSLSGLTTALSVAQGGTGVGTLATNGVIIGNGASALTSVVAGSAGQCLVSTAGTPIWTTCPGSGGVSSLNGGTGALTLNNASLAGSTITINDATTAAKGIASFNATNFNVTSGVVNTIQNINNTAAPTFGQLTLTSSQAANPMFVVNNTNLAASGALLDLQLNGTSKFSVSPAGNITSAGTLNGQTISASANFTGTLAVAGAINGQTISSAANFTGSVAVGTTLSVNTITPTSSLTVGSTGQSFLLQGNASSTFTATNGANATTLAFQTPTANVTYNFPTATAGAYNICTTAGNCAGVGGGVTTPGGTANTIAKFTASGTIGNSSITDNGTTVTVGGTLSVNTITPSSALTVGSTGQNLTLQGTTVNVSSTASGITNSLTFATPSGSNKTVTVPNASGTVAVSASGPLALDASGNLTCPTCLTSGGGGGTAGVTSVNGLTGGLTLQGSSAGSVTSGATTITINDATSAVKGLASFNATNLTVTSGNVNTVQDIAVTSTPTFAGLNLTAALTIANGGTGATTAAGARTNLSAAQSGANTDITSLSGLTTALSVAQGGTGIATTPNNGELLIGNGSGYSLNTLSAGSGVTITNAAGSITISAPGAGTCAGCANTSLSNLASVAINTSLLPGTAGSANLGSGTLPFGQLFLAGTSVSPATNNFQITGASTGGTRTITLPDASGTVAVSASGNIALSATGNITFTGTLGVANGGTGATTLTTNGVLIGNGTSAVSAITGNTGQCLLGNTGAAPSFGACPGSGGVVSVDSLTGALTISNTTGSGTVITINDAKADGSTKGIATFNATNFQDNGSGVINTIQDIATTSAPSFGQLTVTSSQAANAMMVVNNTNASATGNLIDLQLNGSSKFSVAPNGNTTIAGTLAVNTITPSGALTVGATSQNLTLQGGATTKLTATSGGITNTLQFTTPASSNKTITLPNASGTVAVSASGVLTLDANGNLTCPTCVTSGGSSGGASAVDSLDGLTGTLTIANSTGSGSTITIQDASTAQKGLAQFNGTNFSASSGVINTIQDIATSSAPAFGQLTITSSQAANAMMVINNTNTLATGNLIDLQLNGSSKLSVAPNGNTTIAGTLTSGLINGQTIGSSANFTGSVAVGSTLTVNTITPTGSLTVGATGQSFLLQGNGTSTITSRANGHTTTLGFTGGSPTTDPLYQLDSSAATGTYTICTTAGNCVGVGGSVSGSGTANRIAKYTGTGTVIGNSSILDNGSSVTLDSNVDILLQGTTAYISNSQSQTNSEAFGLNASVAGNHDALAVGASAASDTYSVALGATSSASNASVAFGSGTIATGDGSVAIGKSSQSTFTGSIAIGTDSSTTAVNQLVIGSWSHAVTQAVIGNGVSNASPVGFTLQATSTLAGTSNTAGGSITIAGGQGTGTGNGGNINFQIAKAGTTGASQNALSTVATISGIDGSALFKNAADSTTAFQVQNAAGSTSILTVDTTNSRVTTNGGLYITDPTNPRQFSFRVDPTTGLLKLTANSVGMTVAGDGTDSGNVNMISSSKYNSNTGGTISSLYFFSNNANGTTDKIEVAIYADNGSGSPSGQARLGSSNLSGTVLNAGPAWTKIPLTSSVTLSPNTSYWFTFNVNNSSIQYGHHSGLGGDSAFAGPSGTYTFGASGLPATFPSTGVSTGADNYAIYAPYDTVTDQTKASAAFTVDDNNSVVFRPRYNMDDGTNTSATFQVQNAAGAAQLSVDTAGGYVGVNNLQVGNVDTGYNLFAAGHGSTGTAAIYRSTSTASDILLNLLSDVGGSEISQLQVKNNGDLLFGNTGNHTLSVTQASSGAGKSLTVVAGKGASGQIGGDLVLQAGANGTASGTPGSVTVKANGGNSTTAFQVQNAAGTTTVLAVDTSSNIVSVNSTLSFQGASAANINFSGAASTTGNALNITGQTAGSGNNAGGAVTIQGGTATGFGTGGLVTIIGGSSGASGNNGGVTIETSNTASGPGTINIGANAYGHTINIGTNGTGSQSVSIGGTASFSATNITSGSSSTTIDSVGGAVRIGDVNSTLVSIGQFGGSSSATLRLGVGGASGSQTVTLGSVNSGSTTAIQGANSISLLTNSASGTITAKSGTNSATAFQIQDSSSAGLLTADTTARSASGGNLIKIGDSTGTDGALTILKLDSSTADPTSNLSALNGGLFYNSATNKVSLIENGQVKIICNTTDLGCGTGTVKLQDAYFNSTGGTTPEVLLDATRKGLDIQDANSTIGASQALFAVRGSATSSTLGTAYFQVLGDGHVGVNGTASTYQLNVTGSSTSMDALRVQGANGSGSTGGGNALTAIGGNGGSTTSAGTQGGGGGGISLTGGNGGDSTQYFGGLGGSISLIAGNGGMSSSGVAGQSGNGGGVTIQGGTGGAVGVLTSGGAGGNININGGNGGPFNPGGSVNISGGSPGAFSGQYGNISLWGDSIIAKGGSTTAFQVQDLSNNPFLTVNVSTPTITFGNASSGNTITFTPSGGLVAAGTARHTKTILLTPEYAGGVLDALSDASCSSAFSGTMTSGYDSTNRMNYYDWTAALGSAQCYDVVAQVPIPSDFSAWSGNPDIEMQKDSTGTAAYAIQIVPSSGSDANYGSFAVHNTLTTSWSNMANNPLSGTYTAGDYLTVKIRMTSTSGANVKLGNIKLQYLSTF